MVLSLLLFLERTEVLLWCSPSSIAHLTPQTPVIFPVQPLILVSFQIQHLDLKNIIWCFSKRILFLIWPPAFQPLFVLILALSWLFSAFSGYFPFSYRFILCLSLISTPGGWSCSLCHLASLILWLVVRFSDARQWQRWKEEKREPLEYLFVLFLLWFVAFLAVAVSYN